MATIHNSDLIQTLTFLSDKQHTLIKQWVADQQESSEPSDDDRADDIIGDPLLILN